MVFAEQITIPELSGETPRRLFVYTPEELEEDEDRRYPVLYMFDGHNLFYDKTATYGKSWGLKEYLEEHHTPLIVVGVECNHEGSRRLEEYSPYRGPVAGDIIKNAQGRMTLDWIADTLKPVIDASFPTLPEREHTAIAGSSMGGLMAIYAAVAYNHIFSKAAGLSPSISIDLPALLADIENAEIGEDTRIYMDVGTMEMGRTGGWYRDLETVEQALFQKGVIPCLRMVAGGTHSEASWEKQIPVFFRHLGLE